MAVVIGASTPLTIAQAVDVAVGYAPVEIDPQAQRRIELGRAVVDALAARGVTVYGVTTGFASLRDVVIEPSRASELSRNLILSHCVGVGRPFGEHVVRMAMLLRAQALARGCSGVRLGLVQTLVAMLNARVFVHVPSQGSVGSSGDLAPLSHVALALIGDDRARVHGRVLARRAAGTGLTREPIEADFVELGNVTKARMAVGTAINAELEAMGATGVRWPFELGAKEGLALNNGAVFSTALLALACDESAALVEASERVAALSLEAVQAVPDFLHPDVVSLRPHPGHVRSAEAIRGHLRGSELVPQHAALGVNRAHLQRGMMALNAWREEHRAVGFEGPLADAVRGIERTMNALLKAEASAGAGERVEAPKGLDVRAGELARQRERLRPVMEAWQLARSIAHASPGPAADDLDAVWHRHVRTLVRGSPDVQDNYSFRASATVLGCVREAVERARSVAEIEINSATDNPLIALDQLLESCAGAGGKRPTLARFESWLAQNWARAAAAVRSAANFHGQPVGHASDMLAQCVAECGNIAERRVAALTDQHHSKGLPSYLAWMPGLHSGLMIVQYAAASLVAETRLMAMPSTTDSVPTGEGAEDHVAMSTHAGRRCLAVIENVRLIVAMEWLCAYQGVQFRKPARLGAGTARLEDRAAELLERTLPSIRKTRDVLERLGLPAAAVLAVRPCVVKDQPMTAMIEKLAAELATGRGSAGRA